MAGKEFSFGMLNGKVVDKNGKVDNLEDIIKGKYVMLYFSAHWCPPCRGFTPNLVKFYDSNHVDKNFEIIFVSHDRDQGSFNEYFGSMTYFAVDYGESDLRGKLAEMFGVRGIPCLVLLDKNGKILIKNARGQVQSEPDRFPWETSLKS